MPRRLATSKPQRLRAENRPAGVSTPSAASYGAVRPTAPPALLTPPVTSVSPDWYFFGVRPKWAPTARERRNRAGSSTADVNVIATRAPTPGTVITRRQGAAPPGAGGKGPGRGGDAPPHGSPGRGRGGAPPPRLRSPAAPL